MNFRAALCLVPFALIAGGCAAEVDDNASDSEDLTKTATGVSLDASDSGKTFYIEEGKKVVVNLYYGGFTATPVSKWEVTSTDRSFGYPKITTKAPPAHTADMPTSEKLEWKIGPLVHAGETHKVTLTAKALGGGRDKTFTFTAKIIKAAPTGAAEGKMCGGFAGIRCADGLDCIMEEPIHPDEAGICRARFVGAGLGKMCGGIAGIRCAEGLECELSGHFPDASGKCVTERL